MNTINHSHLRLLAVFVNVVECGSFAGAARKLQSSRSRVSEQVSLLEEALTVRLLQRTTRQLQLTAEGKRVFELARGLNDILRDVESVVSPVEPSGTVSLTLNHDIAHRFLIPVLKGFQQRYPKIQLDLILDDHKLDLIAEQIDLAIRIGLPRDESVVARLIHQECFAIFASPNYLQNSPAIHSPNDLAEQRWILFMQTNQPALSLQSTKETIELTPRYAYRCNSPLMAQQMALQGLGLTALLPSTIEKELARGELLPVCPELKGEEVLFSLVYPSRHQLPVRTRVLVDYLLATFTITPESPN